MAFFIVMKKKKDENNKEKTANSISERSYVKFFVILPVDTENKQKTR
mgnify:CR=1 FL=1